MSLDLNNTTVADSNLHPNHALAKKLASAGLPVFPCASSGAKAKSPLVTHGFKDATTDLSIIDAWWQHQPGALVALPTGSASGLSVVDGDIDKETGEAIGNDQVEQLGLANPSAVKVTTPSGGSHHIYRHVDGAKNSTKQAASFIDTRGEGGYIVAPGTVMPDGTSYRYEGRNLSTALQQGDLPPYPLRAVEDAIAAEKVRKNEDDHALSQPAASFALSTDGPLFAIDAETTRATAAETLEIVRNLLSQAPNDLCREDWVKLSASLQVAYGDELQSDFIAFSQRYVGNACDYNTALKLWKSTEKPTQVTSIAPALSLLKIAFGEDSFKAIWRDVLSRRDNDLGDNKKSDASGTNQATPPANANEWPEPDLNIGKPQRPAAPTLSEEDFNHIYGPWAQWLRDAAEVKNAPVDYVALSLLSAAGAAIGNSRWGCPWEGWSEPPILWTMLVGDPSAGKSPAMDAVLDAIKDIEQELAETYKREHSEWVDEKEIAELVLSKWKADAKEAVKDGGEVPDKPADAQISAEPLRERIRISDITTEKVADLLSSTWRGLLLARDELSGWISGMDRYTSGGDRPFWLEAYGGRSYTVDRKNSPDPIVVDHLSVAITGGTQPDKLAELLLNTGDDGLLSRFVVVFPDPVGLKRPVSLLDQHKLVEALKRLRSLPAAITEAGDHRPFYVHFSEDAADILQAFRKQCREWETDASGLFKSHIGKMPGLVVRVANILAHLDWAADQEEAFPGGISADHVGRACDLVGEYLRLHAYRAYGTAKLPPEVSGAVDIAKIIRSEGLKSFKARDIYNRRRTGLSTLKQVSPALDVLIDADWLRVDTKKTGGRPSQTYIVNPKLEVRHG